jgi:hypothetical protein
LRPVPTFTGGIDTLDDLGRVGDLLVGGPG